MGRSLRTQLTGAAFHVTARTVQQIDWFSGPLMPVIDDVIVEGVTSSDAMLLARTVMSNHFHIVLRQGTWSLGRVMQPIMRRIALQVQQRYDFKEYVFGRPFYSVLCDGPDHLRRAVVYTHVNPVRARLCDDPAVYPWTSHLRYIVEPEGVAAVEIAHVLRLFGDESNEPLPLLSERYIKYVAWRLEKDRCEREGVDFATPEPSTRAGDAYYYDFFRGINRRPAAFKKDLRDKAIEILVLIAPHMEIHELRRRHLRRPLLEIRRQLIAALLQAGYRGCAIADYLRISDTAVSVVSTAMRYGNLRGFGIRERGPATLTP